MKMRIDGAVVNPTANNPKFMRFSLIKGVSRDTGLSLGTVFEAFKQLRDKWRNMLNATETGNIRVMSGRNRRRKGTDFSIGVEYRRTVTKKGRPHKSGGGPKKLLWVDI